MSCPHMSPLAPDDGLTVADCSHLWHVTHRTCCGAGTRCDGAPCDGAPCDGTPCDGVPCDVSCAMLTM